MSGRLESLESFRTRAEAWITTNLPSWSDELVDNRELQNRLFDAGFGGIAFPAEYGGSGLTLEHQRVFFDLADELVRQVPTTFNVSIGMLAPTILDHGSEEAKRRFLPPLLRGDELWIQLLSEPKGGSDMAGVTTRLLRDGDRYVLRGAKMWSSRAHHADYGLCLCRSDWSQPKHRGLSMIAVPLRGTPGITIQQTRAVTGLPGEFCEEFFDDVELPVTNLIGEESHGWAVAQTLLKHERNAVGNMGYGYLGGRHRPQAVATFGTPTPAELAVAARGSAAVRHLLADAYVESVVGRLTSARVMTCLQTGAYQGPWGSLRKLQSAVSQHEAARTALAVYGADGVIWDGDEVQLDNAGTTWLGARRGTIAGGTNEIQRNIISERLLGLPREPASDHNLPFSEAMRGTRT